MKTFTEKEVDQIVRSVISETSAGFLAWLEAETDIVDIQTRKVLTDAEIEIKPGRKRMFNKYVYPRLIKHGIIFKERHS